MASRVAGLRVTLGDVGSVKGFIRLLFHGIRSGLVLVSLTGWWGLGVYCRCWSWKFGDNSKLTNRSLLGEGRCLSTYRHNISHLLI